MFLYVDHSYCRELSPIGRFGRSTCVHFRMHIKFLSNSGKLVEYFLFVKLWENMENHNSKSV